MTSETISLVVGDLLKIERRHMVDGVVTTVTSRGRFAGVQVVGSAEHLALEDPKRKSVRLYPLHAISEITLVKRAQRPDAKDVPVTAAPQPPAWDPGVA